jgi:hypothetical protein
MVTSQRRVIRNPLTPRPKSVRKSATKAHMLQKPNLVAVDSQGQVRRFTTSV